MKRRAAINRARAGAEKLWAGAVTIEPSAKTGAHHHGALESIIYVVKGRARMRWGPHLEFTAEAGPGDFIYVPPYVPHQEINAADEPLECVLVRSDQEPVVVNLDLVPVEPPETVHWVDDIHPAPRALITPPEGLDPPQRRAGRGTVHLCFIVPPAASPHGPDSHSTRRVPPLWERMASGLGALPSVRRDAAQPRHRAGRRQRGDGRLRSRAGSPPSARRRRKRSRRGWPASSLRSHRPASCRPSPRRPETGHARLPHPGADRCAGVAAPGAAALSWRPSLADRADPPGDPRGARGRAVVVPGRGSLDPHRGGARDGAGREPGGAGLVADAHPGGRRGAGGRSGVLLLGWPAPPRASGLRDRAPRRAEPGRAPDGVEPGGAGLPLGGGAAHVPPRARRAPPSAHRARGGHGPRLRRAARAPLRARDHAARPARAARRVGAPLPSQLVCPQCGDNAPTLQRFREGLAGSACARCAGALLGPGQVSTLLSMAQVEDAIYRREIRLGSTGTRPLHCPQCGSAMRGVQLRTVAAHGCPACGSLWLDRVGLARLAGGRPVLTSAPAAPAPLTGAPLAGTRGRAHAAGRRLPLGGGPRRMVPPRRGSVRLGLAEQRLSSPGATEACARPGLPIRERLRSVVLRD
jgi:uncharacterized RmlC-like cupin family protein/Zn-finger nucleic acid-binding protein